jgi:integrase/recombinase XerD
VRTRAADRSFAALLAAHVAHIERRRFSYSMRRSAVQLLPRLFEWLKTRRVRDARAVTEAHLFAFVRKLATTKTQYGTPLAPASLSHYVMVLRRFFSFLVKRRFVLLNPAAALELPKRTTLPRVVLSEPQARRLLSAPCSADPLDYRDRAMMEVLYGMGLRLGECLRLSVWDIDLRERQLFVRDGKGKKDRLVPITGRAAVAIDIYLREGRPALARSARETALFLSERGRAPSDTTVRLRLQQHARAAKITGRIYPHALRHTCATHLLRGGADVRHVQEILGHKQIDSTAIYTRVALRDLRDVIKRCHPRENKTRRRYRRKR